jgi:hypothetical protein
MKTILLLLSFIGMVVAQGVSSTPLNTTEIRFVQHLLISVGNPEFDPKQCARNLGNLAILYGLTDQEKALLETSGEAYGASVKTFQAQRAAAYRGPGSQINSSLAAASAQMEQSVASLTNELVAGLSPQTAALVKAYAAARTTAVTIRKGGN